MKETTIHISGMSCQHCVKSVSGALQNVAGVLDVRVNLETGLAVVQFDEALFDTKQAETAITEQGYDVISIQE